MKRSTAMLQQVCLNSMEGRNKYDEKVPRDYAEAICFDAISGNILWQDAINTEMDQLFMY
jgi:hypothetical protein